LASITKQIDRLIAQLDAAMHADRIDIRRGIRRLRKQARSGAAADHLEKTAGQIESRLAASIRQRAFRRQHAPAAAVNPALPIAAQQQTIVAAIAAHPVVIVSGATGSGKTTQLPKCCLAAGRGIDGLIGCTQPRRIAAASVAHRIAEELGEPLGRSVGYKIRFKEALGETPFIKLMTDGILLAETHLDPWLNAYDTLIVDEAHERSLNIDFILGIVKNLLTRRKDLKLVVSSATIDTEKFSQHFADAPVVEVSGRMYPVATHYRNPADGGADGDDVNMVEAAVDAVADVHRRSPFGDMLVFMPTEQDIRDTCDLIAARGLQHVAVLPLFARLPAARQKKVFSRPAGRKIIVATNIAETSLTIPGIKYVIDSGLARMAQYSPRSRVTALPVVPISRSSADQRQGRCGRIENGVCIRLYSEADYLERPLYTRPEILRSNLAEVILKMISLGLGDIERFPFLDRPAHRSIKDGLQLLAELGAIERRPFAKNAAGRIPRRAGGLLTAFVLTDIGRRMARMPIDPRLSRIIVEAARRGCLPSIVTIASVLSIQDPRERPAGNEVQADQAQAVFKDPRSDFMTLLNIWNAYQDALGDGTKTAARTRRFCRDHYLSFRRMREWSDIRSQMTQLLKDMRLKTSLPAAGGGDGPFDPQYTAVHQSILSGFLSNAAQQKEKHIFKAAGGREVMVFPGSAVFKKPGPWIVAAELVETSRLFARTAAMIAPAWLEEIGADLCRTTHQDPHWDKSRGQVMAREQVSLYGLIIVADRRVPYGPVDADTANDVFIREALMADDLGQDLGFLTFNRNLLNNIRRMEDRLRRQDILIDAENRFQFYKSRLPDIADVPSLKKRIREKGGDAFLKMRENDLLRYRPDPGELALYPQKVDLGHRPFQCLYRFNPGAEDDGVTVRIPETAAAGIDAAALDWLVPGLLGEKIEALIKNLPKRFRKQLVPIAGTVETIIREMPRGKGSLIRALSAFVHQRFLVDIPASAWAPVELPAHLKMRVALTDTRGRTVAAGRDPGLLQRQAAAVPEKALEAVRRRWEKENLEAWDVGDLPAHITADGGHGDEIILYPALVDAEKTVALRLFTDPKQAAATHRRGVAALLAGMFRSDMNFLKKNLKLAADLKSAAADFGGLSSIEQALFQKVREELLARDIRRRDEFNRQAETLALCGIHNQGQDKRTAVIRLLKAFHDARGKIRMLQRANHGHARIAGLLEQLQADLRRMAPPNAVELYTTGRLERLPAYLQAIAVRAERAAVDFEKDRQRARTVQPFADALMQQLARLSAATSDEKRAAVEAFHWLLEEYKISVFAQQVGTARRVSAKALKKALEEIERMV